MITKITCRYSFEVLDFNCNDFDFTFNIGVSYLDIIMRHHWNNLVFYKKFKIATTHCAYCLCASDARHPERLPPKTHFVAFYK